MIEPHGNLLINRVLKPADAERQAQRSSSLRHLPLNDEQVKDVKNIARGVYSPLTGFMVKADFDRVVSEMKLANGLTWPIPFVLDVAKEVGEALSVGEQVMLVNETDAPVALLTVQDVYTFNADTVAQHVFGTTEVAHPGVALVQSWQPYLVGGDIELIDNSKEPYNQFNLDPQETRLLFRERGWNTVTGFQTRNAPHRAHEYLQRVGLELTDGLFINPVIGKKKAGDFVDDAILAAYQYMVDQVYPKKRVVLSILPLQMRYAGPREAILHAIIRKNFGCTHFIVGRDHAGVGTYYGTYAAQEIFRTIDDLGIIILNLENSFWCKRCETVSTSKTCGHAADQQIGPSGTVIRKLLQAGEVVPNEIMRPEISELLIKLGKVFVE